MGVALEHARVLRRIADDNRGKDILLLDLRKATALVDFFVIVTAVSRRQSHAIASEIDQEMKKLGEAKLGLEGSEEGRWTLIDYGDFVVHIFSPDDRAYYALEDIWGDAPQLDWQERQPAGPARIEAGVDESPPGIEDDLRLGLAGGRRSGRLREGGAPGDRPQVRRLSGQRLHGAGQGDGRKPRDLAQELAGQSTSSPMAGPPEVAGPGFLNVRLNDAWIAAALRDLLVDEHLGLTPPSPGQDGRDRLLLAQRRQADARGTPALDGHRRQPGADHRGQRPPGHPRQPPRRLGLPVRHDPLGLEERPRRGHTSPTDPVGELARLYRLVQDRIKAGDSSVEDAARVETAKLHAGDPENRALWNQFMPHCLGAIQAIYDRLGIRFDVQLGESFYDPQLGPIVEDLQKKGLAVESDGAIVVFVEQTEAPFIVRKRDGAFTYATTDLATIQYRVQTWHPDQILYVVDHRQGDHFKQLFEVARKWGYDSIDFEHVAFGTILGQDRRPFKTREGDVVGLESLLDEATAEALKVVKENSPELEPDEQQRVAVVVGLGAIKYADLSQNRISDYVFDWQKMMAMNGNTATYLQYAYARTQSIFRKGGIAPEAIREQRPTIALSHPAERALGVRLLRLPEVLELARFGAEAEHPDRLPLRSGQRLQHVLPGMPGAQGGVRRTARQPAGALRPDRQDLEIWSRPAWNRCGGPDVSPAATGRRSRRPIRPRVLRSDSPTAWSVLP